ncbi:DUF3307 domain-containing protein [Streptomyces sp. PTM05]|uniref:DUF3307 domain-containing protein n=1 Tax=Streptantibioticus parmotrematis TaxID=2873249 RepID=A0ABS7QXV8_9ACTN|nr:DUF3307 domain-containing protein [Streptantibioticus parmotrematis]MBY8888051.1 DUF3307 domain-containing protein [Streptantibioticus parmotrematis]
MTITFAVVFIALYVAHSVGDHWVQTSRQAADKGRSGWPGRLADTRHVASLTLTKAMVLALVAGVLGLHLRVVGLVVGFAVDAASHWWADRRSTLAWLAKVTRNSEFYELGTPAHPAAPATAAGGYAPTLDTGAYALDQSWHHLWLLIAALIIAAV